MERTSIPTAAGVVSPKIEMVDPEKLIAQAVTQTAPAPSVAKATEVAPKKTNFLSRSMEILRSGYFKAAAVATTFATATLIPRIGNASVLEKLVEFAQAEAHSLSWRGVLAIAGILTLGVILNRIYFNPQYKARPGDPTPKRILSKIILPWIGTALMVGTAIYGASMVLPFLATSLAVSSSTVYLALLGGAAGITALLFLRSMVKELYNRAQTVKLDLNKHSLKNRFLTNFISYNAQLADAIYMTYRAVTLTSVTAAIVLKIAYGMLNPAALLADIGLGAGVGLVYYFLYHRQKAKLVNPLQHSSKPMRGLRSMLKLSTIGAVTGAIASAAGPSYLINLMAAFTFFAAEAFGALHAWRWSKSSRAVEETPTKIYTDQDVISAALLPETQYVTMFKTGFASNLSEVIPALWTNILTRQGTNWEVAQTNGQDPFSNRRQFEDMYNSLSRLMEFNAMFREWIKEADKEIEHANQGGDTARALEALAFYYERFANYCTVPNADNNGVPGYFGNFGRNGFAGFEDENTFHGTSDDTEHNRGLGRRIYTLAGTFMRDKAARLRELAQEYRHVSLSFSDASIEKPSHEEVIAILKRAVDQLYRKHNAPIQLIAPYMFSNRRLQISIAKIGTLNKYQSYVKDAWTGMSLVRFDPANERFYLELIPTKVVRALKTERDEDTWRTDPDELNYRQVRNADSGDNEDNRFKWVDRPVHTIGETHSDILYIDNSVHFRDHRDDLSIYPTAFDQEVPMLQKEEYFEIVFKNGSRLRVFEDGTGMHLDRHGHHLSRRLAPTEYEDTRSLNGNVIRRFGDGTIQVVHIDQNGAETIVTHRRNGIRWLPGTAEPADDLLRCDAKRKDLRNEGAIQDFDVTWVKDPSLRPKNYFFNRTPFQSLSDSEQVDLIVTDFLANFEEDQSTPYVFLQWRIKEERKFDFDCSMLDSSHDQVLMVSPTIAYFTLKAQERSGRTLYIPYGLQKEWFPTVSLYSYTAVDPNDGKVKPRPDRSNENVAFPEWKAIDDQEGAALVTPAMDPDCPFEKALRVKVKFTSRENRDGKVITTPHEYYRYLWYPRYLEAPGRYALAKDSKNPAQQVPAIQINVHQEKIGPAPFVKFTVVRRNANGEVIKRDGTVVDQKLWETVVTFHPLSEQEYRKSRSDIQAKAPWVDNNGMVHLPNGTVMDHFEYHGFKEEFMAETLYERFLPAANYLHHFEPSEVE